MLPMSLLCVSDLHVGFGSTEILRGVSFDLEPGETLGVVGESGCGKSMTGFAIMGMLQSPGKVTKGSIQLDGVELVGMKERDMRKIRGQDIALVMQDPFTSLNPMMRIADQIAEAYLLHEKMSKAEAYRRAVDMLDKVGVPAPESSARKYPHQLSGGQRQRVVIAMAFACNPKVLIADEPTTALDVTLQAQILRLVRDLQQKEGTSVILISHDIGAIASIAHRIAVFYAGRIVEIGRTEQVLKHASHPYTRSLLMSLPRAGQERLESISGQPPDFAKLTGECAFAPRCPLRIDQCSTEPELLPEPDGTHAACWRRHEVHELPFGTSITELVQAK
jgi:oligopeptide/dipeptide ABC transporter ATP-binding protein